MAGLGLNPATFSPVSVPAAFPYTARIWLV
jgi:hypothetical protein